MESYPIYSTPSYGEWVEFVGCQIFYLQGSSYRATQDVAGQILLAWEAKYQDKEMWRNPVLSFVFESSDPHRNSIPNMVASLLLQAMAGQHMGSTGEIYGILQDSVKFRK